MATTHTDTSLTLKQRRRLEDLQAADDEVKIKGWSAAHRGPIVQFVTGYKMVITRDGGLTPA